jgi:hypothetical protein
VNSVLRLPVGLFEELRTHLLPPHSRDEQAAFLFVEATRTTDLVTFEVMGSEKLTAHDFETQSQDYLELKDETRSRLIKRAHDLGAALVEMHSHPAPWPAAFSLADRLGLQETVPHMWWRLPKRPYLAIVIAPSGFDALLWIDNPHAPQALGCLLAGDRLLRPTNNSLEGWK